MAANAAAGVGPRPVPQEPMYIIINLGLSENFGAIDYEGLASLWPVHMVSPANRGFGLEVKVDADLGPLPLGAHAWSSMWSTSECTSPRDQRT